MPKRMSSYERRKRATELLRAAIPALGLTVRAVAQGPFKLKTSWPHGLRKTERAVWYWFNEDNPHYPAGKTLVRVEKFLAEAEAILRKRGLIHRSLEETIPAEAKP